jgi:hypothetical protein
MSDLRVKLWQTPGGRELFQNAARGKAFAVPQFPSEALAIGLENPYLSVGAANG